MRQIKEKVDSALRWSEQYTKTDMVYLAKGGLWTTLNFIIGTIASIIMAIAFGNLLPRETYGTYSYLISLGATLSFLTISGIGTAVIRAVARGYENVVPTALKLQLKYNLFAVATVLSAALYYGYKGNILFSASFAILALTYPIAEAFHIYEQVFIAKKRFDILTKVAIITTFASTLVTVTTLLLTHNIIILIAVYASMSLLLNAIAYKMTTLHLDKATPDLEQVKEMRRTAFHLTGAGLIGTLAQYVDKIVLFQVAGPAALAIYAFATAGPDRLKSLVKHWAGIAMPRLAQISLIEIRRIVYKRIGLSILIGLALFLAYLFFVPLLFRLFLPRYLDSILYSQVLALGLIIAPATIYVGYIFASQNMLRATYALSTGSQVVRIVLFLVFGWLWQIWGLIAASLLSTLLNAIYSIVIFEVETRRLIKR